MKKVNSKGYFFAALFLGLVGGVAQAGPIRGKSLIFLAFFLSDSAEYLNRYC